jgi:hypothetical protein
MIHDVYNRIIRSRSRLKWGHKRVKGMLLPHRARSASAKPNCICQRYEAVNIREWLRPCLPILFPIATARQYASLRHWVQAAIGLPSYSAADEYFQITPLALLASQTSQTMMSFYVEMCRNIQADWGGYQIDIL